MSDGSLCAVGGAPAQSRGLVGVAGHLWLWGLVGALVHYTLAGPVTAITTLLVEKGVAVPDELDLPHG